MSNFNLTHTGQVVDDAITKVSTDDYNGTHDTVAALITHLQGLSSLPAANTLYKTNGRTAFGDSPRRVFALKNGAHTDNGGTIRTVSGNDHIEMIEWDGDVRDFGAKPDNTTNSTTFIQAALDYVLADASRPGLLFVDGTFRCNDLTIASSTNPIVWRGRGNAKIQQVNGSTDAVLLMPRGDTNVADLTFEDYRMGFQFDDVATDAIIKFNNCNFVNCGNTTVSTSIDPSGRLDNSGAICNRNNTGNNISSVTVTNCTFDGHDFAFAWRNRYKNIIISNCSFRNLKRMAIWAGQNATVFAQTEAARLTVTGCTFDNIVSDDATENEVHAIQAYGYEVNITDNSIDTVADIFSGSNHNSEAIYTKAALFNISDNVITDGGRGDAPITAKGNATGTDIEDLTAGTGRVTKCGVIANNTIYLTDTYVATYSLSSSSSAIFTNGSRVDVLGNHINCTGTYNTIFYLNGTGLLANNHVIGKFGIGVRAQPLGSGHPDLTSWVIHNNNFNAISGSNVDSFISTTMLAGQTNTLPMLTITDNRIRLEGSSTGSGDQSVIKVKVQKGTNVLNRLLIKGNYAYIEESGDMDRFVKLDCASGTGTNEGEIGEVVVEGNRVENVNRFVRIEVTTAGKIARAFVLNNISNVDPTASNDAGSTTFIQFDNKIGNLTSSGNFQI
jgi:hypothetical protein